MTAASVTSILCELPAAEVVGGRIRDQPSVPRLRSAADLSPVGGKIILQPRLCTLRSYGSGAIRSPAKVSAADVSPFFASLTDYVESARRSHDFEIVSGRLSMIIRLPSSLEDKIAFFQIAFAATVGVELVTGNSLFKKLDVEEIVGAAGVCIAVVASAAVFAWFSSARARIGQMLTLSCNSFVDSLVDNIIDGLFYERDLNDWSDDI